METYCHSFSCSNHQAWYEFTNVLNNVNYNKAIITNCIKAKIDKTQKNGECRLCGDRDKTVNHIISECNKLAKKGKQDQVRMHEIGDPLGIVQEIKIWPCWQMNMHKPEPVLENEVQKILWHFEIQMDHWTPVRRPDLVLINKEKRTCQWILQFQWTTMWK